MMFSPGYIRDQNLINKFKDRSRKSNSIHPSALDKCSREIVYDMTKEPPKPSITWLFKKFLRNGSDGKYAHNCIVADLGDTVVAREHTLEIKDRCDGKIDAIISNNDKESVLEIKTIKQERFRRIKGLNKPERAMELQLVYYMWRMDLPGWLYVENKNTQEYIEFYYPTYKIPLLDEIKDKIELINNHLDNDTLPDREHTKDSNNCKWCQWTKDCYK